MHNSKYQLPYGSQLHLPVPPTSYHFLAAQQEPCKKSLTLNKKNVERNFWSKKKSQENGPLAKKWQDWKSQKTRQKNERGDRKGESMTALRFQTVGRHQTSPASLQRLWHWRDTHTYPLARKHARAPISLPLPAELCITVSELRIFQKLSPFESPS